MTTVSKIKCLEQDLQEYDTCNKNVYFDALDDTVDEYNNPYQNNIKMKPINVKSNSDAEYNADSFAKDSKFKVGDHVRISKYKIFLLKDNIKTNMLKLKIQFHGHILLMVLMAKKLLKRFMKKNCRSLLKR